MKINQEYISVPQSDIKFEKPDFDCELLKEVNGDIIGCILIDNVVPKPVKWVYKGKCWGFDGSSKELDEYNLTPIKPKWHDDLGDGVLCWRRNELRNDYIVCIVRHEYDNMYGCSYGHDHPLEELTPLTKEEALKYIHIKE